MTVAYSFLETSLHEGVFTLWMNRPEQRNAFHAGLIAELDAALQAAIDDDAVRVVVLAGRGRHFSAGADLNWMRAAAHATPESNLEDALAMARMLRRLAECPKPTVARVQGAAMGGGMGLVAACDIAIAADTARFATSEVRLGIIPSAIAPYVLRAIGARQAQRWFVTAEVIDANRAQAIDLVHEVVPEAELDATVAVMVDVLRQGGPQAQAAAKLLIADVAWRPLDDALVEETSARIARLRITPEAQEGLSAFLEKRPAAWLGEPS